MNLIKMREGYLENGLIELANYVKSLLGDNLNIVEIGSYAGESTNIFANIFPNSVIYSVDRWESYDCSTTGIPQIIHLDEAEKIFDIVHSNHKNIIKNKISSTEYHLNLNDNSIDFIYIDGDHTYDGVKNDIINYYSKIKNGGIISGHDYGCECVKRAVNDNIKKIDKVFIDTSWLHIKNNL